MRTLAILFAALVAAVAAKAEEYRVVPLDHSGTTFTYPNNSVLRDRDGYLWITNADGVARLDGYSHRQFYLSTQSHYRSDESAVQHLAQDSCGRIWMTVNDKGAFYLDMRHGGKVTPLDAAKLQGERAGYICPLRDGHIAISGASTIHILKPDLECDRAYVQPEGIRERVRCILEASDGRLMLVFWNNGVVALDRATGATTHYGIPSPGHPTAKIVEDTVHHCFYIATWGGGVFRMKDGVFTPQQQGRNAAGDVAGITFNLIPDLRHNTMWVQGYTSLMRYSMTDDGTLRYDGNVVVHNDGYVSIGEGGEQSMRDACLLPDGDLLVGCVDRSAYILHRRNEGAPCAERLYSLRSPNSPKPVVTALARAGQTVVMGEDKLTPTIRTGQPRTGLMAYRPEDGAYSTRVNGGGDLYMWNVRRMVPSYTPGTMWVMLHRESKYVQRIAVDSVTMQAMERVAWEPGQHCDMTAVTETRDGWLYLSGKGGFYRYHIATGRYEMLRASMPAATDMTEHPKGGVWIAGREGLWHCNADGTITPEGECDDISALCYEPVTGKLLVGTFGGRVMMGDEDVSVQAGAGPEAVGSIKTDGHGMVWIVMRSRIVAWDVSGDHPTRIHYAGSEELPMEILYPESAIADDSLGLMVGGLGGYVTLGRHDTAERTATSLPQLCQLRTAGQDVLLDTTVWDGNTIRLSTDDSQVWMSFSTRRFAGTNAIRFAYRMDKDTAWTALSAGDNTLMLNNIVAGSHTLQVRATDTNGNWCHECATFAIVRPPHWWQRWWMKAIYALTLAGIATAAAMLWLRRIRKRQQEQMQSTMLNMKLNYLTNISHDLLTPLSIVNCVADEIATQHPEEEEHVSQLKGSTARLQRLLSQALDMRRLESGRMELHLGYGDMLPFVQGVVASCRPLADNKGLKLVMELGDQPVCGFFDSDKVDKVLFNLLSNAIKYTDEGGAVTVTLGTKDEGRTAVISVADTGAGIAQSELTRVFNRFYDHAGGNGVGLSICRQMMELHHGTITAASDGVGCGSTFTVTVPIGADSDAPTSAAPSQGRENGTDAEGELATVMIVEDDGDLRRMLCSAFSRQYAVVEAANGEEAWNRLIAEDCAVTVVVSDVMMPRMDGLTLCRKIKNEECTSHIGVILLTARNREDDREECYRAGADTYFAKPFSMGTLRARVDAMLAKKREQQAAFAQSTEADTNGLGLGELDRDWLERATAIVMQNLGHEDFNTETLAREMAMSRSTFSRKIKAVTGQTPLEFVRQVTLREACRLLRTGRYNITEVAERLGFYNRKYFTSCFKDAFGVTPSEYVQEPHSTSSPPQSPRRGEEAPSDSPLRGRER